MFINLSYKLPRQSRKINAQADIDPRRLKASAKLYSGQSFKAIKSHDSMVRGELLTKAIRIPSAFDGCYVLPGALAVKTQEQLRLREIERKELVNTFLINDYPGEREAARIALNGSFRESDFPESDILRAQFGMSWSMFSFEVPNDLPDDVKEAERTKFKDNMENVFTECREALRNTMAELINHLSDRLKPDEDGTRKRLSRTTVDNLKDFLNTVNARDITSDEAILKISEQAREILKNYSADDLKGKWTGERVQVGLDQVKRDLNDLIKRDQGRKIDLDLE
jgi:hypothetical protein